MNFSQTPLNTHFRKVQKERSGFLFTETKPNVKKQALQKPQRKKVPETSSRFTLTYSDNGARFPENVDFKNPKTLGLQLVNALVEQINGTIELEKEKETKYTIRFEDKLPLLKV